MEHFISRGSSPRFAKIYGLSAAEAEDTLAAPGVDDARLKECIVAASALVYRASR